MSGLEGVGLADGGLSAPGETERDVAVVPAGALASPRDTVPMAGTWSATRERLEFAPHIPFAHGTVYALVRARSGERNPPGWTELARLQYPPLPIMATTTVVAIHPDVVEVPENLLRLSVTFSAPIEEGSAAGHVHLQDAEGEELDRSLLAMPPELWDMPRRRLTLLLEPGRIKRGLAPNRELGAPLVQATTFDVVVEPTIRDATGAPLASGGRRTYRVGPAVRRKVEPERWRITWPPPGSRSALLVDFDRPLDHALALRALTVLDHDRHLLRGRSHLDLGDTRWSFTPAAPWPVRPLSIRVDTALEDLAGNSVRRVFDRDLRLRQDDPVEVQEILLSPQGP